SSWPKLFQNLRASRETELAAIFPLHVVCAWLGNSALIAQNHYLQVTEKDYLRATSGGPDGGALSGAVAVPQAGHPAGARDWQESSDTHEALESRGLVPILSTVVNALETSLVAPRGLEPLC